MSTHTLQILLEAVRHLSTEFVFVLILAQMAGFVLATLFSLDLLGIMLAAMVRNYSEQHLTIRPMARRLGVLPPYHRADRNAIIAVFLRGLESTSPDRTVPPSLPSL